MNQIIIEEVKINLDAPDLKKAKTVAAVRKLKVFSHLEDDERIEKAESELFQQLGLSGDSQEDGKSEDLSHLSM